MDYKKKTLGFTLIELLLAITIIAVVAGLGLLAYSSTRQKASDTRRVKDIEQIQTALKLYLYSEGSYPGSLNFGQALTGSTSSTTYMALLPSDPQPRNSGACENQSYEYQLSPTSTDYKIGFCLSTPVGTLMAGPKCATPKGIIDSDCALIPAGGSGNETSFTCGVDQVTITTIADHECSEDSPYFDRCTYDTVLIGTQCWMKQNLNIGAYLPGMSVQTNDGNLQKYCYNNDTGICTSDGALYQWDEATQYFASEPVKGICPDGWHIPSDNEFGVLEYYLNDTTCDVARDTTWQCANAGTELQIGGTSGFEFPLAGNLDASKNFTVRTVYGILWSSTIHGANIWTRVVGTGLATVGRNYYERTRGYSVRCLKD